jgi:hypothetical protein
MPRRIARSSWCSRPNFLASSRTTAYSHQARYLERPDLKDQHYQGDAIMLQTSNSLPRNDVMLGTQRNFRKNQHYKFRASYPNRIQHALFLEGFAVTAVL